MISNIYNNMKRISLLFIISLFINGVFGDKDERVSVTDGGSVTLHTNLTDLKGDDVIVWRFNNSRIARINRAVSENPVYESDERFTDRLKMNPQTGDLTITNITSELTGYYHLEIINDKTITKTFSVSVFGDKYERVSVNDGGSVTLHTDITDLKRDDVIMWRFNGNRIAKINREINENPVYESDKRFTDRLKMNPQTGDLTITNITSEHTGDYQLEINGDKTITKTFSISLSPQVKALMNGDSVSLHIDVSEKQRNDKIHWKIKHKNSLIAEIITQNGKISTPFIDERFRETEAE